MQRAEGACHSGAESSRRNLVVGWILGDPDHDAAMRISGDAPGSGPNLYCGVKAMESGGRRYLGSLIVPIAEVRRAPKLRGSLGELAALCRTQDNTLWRLAGCNEPPQRYE
jgi:hypothetical protein